MTLWWHVSILFCLGRICYLCIISDKYLSNQLLKSSKTRASLFFKKFFHLRNLIPFCWKQHFTYGGCYSVPLSFFLFRLNSPNSISLLCFWDNLGHILTPLQSVSNSSKHLWLQLTAQAAKNAEKGNLASYKPISCIDMLPFTVVCCYSVWDPQPPILLFLEAWSLCSSTAGAFLVDSCHWHIPLWNSLYLTSSPALLYFNFHLEFMSRCELVGLCLSYPNIV